jgi:glycosyltransferase involved in cell wall biosynthesis
MDIGFDLSAASINQAGTGIYTRQLASALVRLHTGDTFHHFAIRQTRDMSAPKTLRSRLETLCRDLVWMHIKLPSEAKRARVDLLHMPAGIIPLQSPCPVVVTILDAILFKMPEAFPGWQWLYFQALGPRSARHARRILTISEQSKRDIVSQFDVAPEKVVVTYPAAAPEFKLIPKEAVESIREYYDLGRFILSVGTVEPRKNLVRLLEAFAGLRQIGFQYSLIHVGPTGWMERNIFTSISHLGLEGLVRFLGRIPLADLVALYNAASILVYPSLYEGFGLPVLEAMSCGCPVVTSNVSSLPEVAGDAAILVDPYDVNAMMDAIQKIIVEPGCAEGLRQRGFEQAKRFSWERCAQESLQVYHEAVGR